MLVRTSRNPKNVQTFERSSEKCLNSTGYCYTSFNPATVAAVGWALPTIGETNFQKSPKALTLRRRSPRGLAPRGLVLRLKGVGVLGL